MITCRYIVVRTRPDGLQEAAGHGAAAEHGEVEGGQNGLQRPPVHFQDPALASHFSCLGSGSLLIALSNAAAHGL